MSSLTPTFPNLHSRIPNLNLSDRIVPCLWSPNSPHRRDISSLHPNSFVLHTPLVDVNRTSELRRSLAGKVGVSPFPISNSHIRPCLSPLVLSGQLLQRVEWNFSHSLIILYQIEHIMSSFFLHHTYLYQPKVMQIITINSLIGKGIEPHPTDWSSMLLRISRPF